MFDVERTTIKKGWKKKEVRWWGRRLGGGIKNLTDTI